jgi:hypothetical protein
MDPYEEEQLAKEKALAGKGETPRQAEKVGRESFPIS